MHRWLLLEGTISPAGLSPPSHIICRAKLVAHYYCSTTKVGASGLGAILSTQPTQGKSGKNRSTLPTSTKIWGRDPPRPWCLRQHPRRKALLSTIFSLRH